MADAPFPPLGATDCHVHVIGPKRSFPLQAERAYTPMDAPVGDLAAMLKRLGLTRVVIVQPSFYGTDNACTLDGLGQLANARGVAVLAADTPASELDALHAQGIRGLRVNVATRGAVAIDTVRDKIAAAARLGAVHGWHVQVFMAADAIEALAPFLRDLPVDTVIDHFGLVPLAAPDAPTRTLQALLETGKVWVKISGAYRIADDPADPRIDSLARGLCAANSERIVWGSDWPHTPKSSLRRGASEEELPFQDIEAAELLALLPRWLKDDTLVRRVLVDNPARLYGF